MLEANDNLEQIFESAVQEAEKRKHEYVTVEHLLLALIKNKDIKVKELIGNLLFQLNSILFFNA